MAGRMSSVDRPALALAGDDDLVRGQHVGYEAC